MPEDAAGVPSTRPKPNPLHIAAAEAEETLKSAMRITLARIHAAYTGKDPMKDGPKRFDEAKAYVDKHGAEKIMAEHNKPSAEDLDALADELKAKEATEKKSAAWGKSAGTKKQ